MQKVQRLSKIKKYNTLIVETWKIGLAIDNHNASQMQSGPLNFVLSAV